MSASDPTLSGTCKATFAVALCVLALACTDQGAERNQQTLAFLAGWFDEAAAGARDDGLCHGLGTLKHPEVSCAEMLEHAARIDPASRTLETIDPMDCFETVCGEFMQVRFASFDTAGNEIRETAVVKRDEGKQRLYWYRSDSLLAQLRAAHPDEDEDEKDPVQLAYDEIVARYPALYAYPPCYDLRVSSSNLAGELMAKDAMDVAAIESHAAACGEAFCFGLVGNKIAPVCPR